jgi:hypothetical protein
MTRLRQLERIAYVEELIRKRKTGPPRILAIKLQLSIRTVYRLIEDLKIYYHPALEIVYSKESASYIFLEDNGQGVNF